MTSPKQLEAIRAVEQLFPVGSKVLLKYSASDEMGQVARHEDGPQTQRLLQHAENNRPGGGAACASGSPQV
jgi:hypothetical protein